MNSSVDKKKLRIGLISEQLGDAQKLKQEYPDSYITHSKNIIEFYQQQSQNTFDAILFLNNPDIKKQLSANLQYIRQKRDWAQIPICILSNTPVIFDKPIKDLYIRYYFYEKSLFMPVLNFFSSLDSQGKVSDLITQQKIEDDFTSSLGEKLGKGTVFISRLANPDEAHESYICQLSDEISTHLMWIKLSARILENGSEPLKKMFSSQDNEELQMYMEQLLKLVFNEFKSKLIQNLEELGALHFVNSDNMDPKDRVSFIKTSKAYPLIFESNTCSILLEVIQYI